jgi:Papain-like cysteine protease AvrRpt2
VAIHEILPVPYHQQDTDYYCGAACAQMVLASISGGIQSQDGIYTDERNHTNELASWYNPPDGLQWVLNDRRPAGFNGWFALYSLATEDAISRKLCWTIHHYGVAAIAMVYKGDHWIVVRGFEASSAPADYGDTSYTISAFDVNNPWPPTPSFSVPTAAPPPPHSATDGCGSGGNRGVANEHITYATWQSTYATGNKYGSLWYGKYVAVCDPDPPPKYPGAQPRRVRRARGETLLRPATAIKNAFAGLERHGLFARKDWKRALSNTQPGTPMLVQRLDETDSYYFIVPLKRRRKRITAAIAVDARFGDYRQAIALPPGGSSILTTLDSKMVLKQIVGHTLEIGEMQERLRVRKEGYCLYPTLVWRPCLESLSPFFPFHMVTVGNERIYVRLDGKIFTALHIDIPGI